MTFGSGVWEIQKLRIEEIGVPLTVNWSDLILIQHGARMLEMCQLFGTKLIHVRQGYCAKLF